MIVGIFSFYNAIEPDIFEKGIHVGNVLRDLVQVAAMRLRFVLCISHAVVELHSNKPCNAGLWHKMVALGIELFLRI